MRKCKICKIEIKARQNKFFCSIFCSSISRRIPMPECISCKKPVKWRGKVRFCSRKCAHSKQNNPKWHGGFTIDRNGYKMKWIPPEERKNSNHYVREHRYIMEKYLGRKLKKNEVVHHINEDRLDNRIENLQVVTRSNHQKFHMSNKHGKII